MNVNKENIAKVIKAIEGEAGTVIGFNMSTWVDSGDKDHGKWHCGTTACIAGHAYLLATGSPVNQAMKVAEFFTHEIEETAAAWLGIDVEVADDLFVPASDKAGRLDNITADRAIATLKHLADTGVIDWKRT